MAIEPNRIDSHDSRNAVDTIVDSVPLAKYLHKPLRKPEIEFPRKIKSIPQLAVFTAKQTRRIKEEVLLG